MRDLGISGFIFPIIFILLIVAGAAAIAILRYRAAKKNPPADEAEKKERRKKRLRSTFTGCSIGCVALFLIMMLVALPDFLHSRLRNRQAEARTILTGIYEAELAFHQSNNRYSADPNEIGFVPAVEPTYYRWEITYADDERFEAHAWGNIDRDDTIDTWEVTEASREPAHTIDDASE